MVLERGRGGRQGEVRGERGEAADEWAKVRSGPR